MVLVERRPDSEPRPGVRLVLRPLAHVDEIAALDGARLASRLVADFAVAPDRLGQSAEHQIGRERRQHQVPVVPRRELHRIARERSHIGPERTLAGLGADLDLVGLEVLAVVRDDLVLAPAQVQQLDRLGEDFGRGLEIGAERRVFVRIVTPPGGEIDPARRQLVERGPFLGDVDRVVQRQHHDRRAEPDAAGQRRDVGVHQARHRHAAAPVEVMLADPGRMHSDVLGMDRLVANLEQELLGGPRIVGIAVVAEREIAEFHRPVLRSVSRSF
jgi:hypothetical protein